MITILAQSAHRHTNVSKFKCKDGALHDTTWTIDRNMPRTITLKCQANILNTKGGRLDTILYPDDEAPAKGAEDESDVDLPELEEAEEEKLKNDE